VGDLQLVLLREAMGGDCWHRACLLHDTRTQRFASPLDVTHWERAERTKPGTCGPFMFDQWEQAFLTDDALCVLVEGCQSLGGSALGWLVPGEIVGRPGVVDS
jgi:hypothetical protein